MRGGAPRAHIADCAACRTHAPSALPHPPALRLFPLPLLLAALTSTAALAQAGKPSPQAECTATNREKHAELLQELDAARKRSVMNPVLVSRLQTFEQQQAKLREALRRTARNEAECEQIAGQIEAEAERLAKMLGNEAAAAAPAASPPAPVAAPAPSARALAAAPAAPPPPAPPPPVDLTCLNGVAQDFNGVVQTLVEARRDARAPESELEPLAQRLNALRERTAATMQQPQPTREQCDALARELAREREALQRVVGAARRAATPVVLAAVPPPVVVTAPQPSLQPSSMQAQPAPAPPMPAPAPAPAYRTPLAPEPSPEQAAASMRTASVESSRPPDPRARACSGELRLSFRDVEQAITSLADGGSIAQQGKQMARRLLQMLLVQQVVIFSREFLSLEDCQQLAQTIADLRAQAQQLRATYAEARGQAQQQAAFQPQQQAYAAPQPPRVDPRIESCKAQVRQGYNDARQQLQFAARSGRMTPQKAQALQMAQGRLSNLGGMAQRDFGSLMECQNVANALMQERNNIQGLAKY